MARTRTPMQLALRMEQRGVLPRGPDEYFHGYGVLALPFASGHVLALRHMVASSVGPPFTSVWHRDPRGRWTFFINTEPRLACPRYFGPAVRTVQQEDIDVLWTGPGEVAVHVAGPGLHWAVRIGATPLTRSLGLLAGACPRRLWQLPAVPECAGALAGTLLRTGPLRLRGTTPAGYRYLLQPTAMYTVTGSAAMIGSRELGRIRVLEEAVGLGGYMLPRAGLVAFGRTTFRPGREPLAD